MPDVAELRVKISLDGAEKVASGLKQADSSVSSFASNAGKMGGALGSVATQFAAFGVVAGGAVVAGLGAAVSKASDFEAGMSRVKAASSASASEMAALGSAAIALGADTQLAGIGATDAASAMEELAKGGVSVSDQLGGATKGALLLASSGSIAVADAAGIATKAMNIFGLAGTDVAHVADLMSAGANKSATDVGQLGAAFNQSAAVAKNAGLDIETLTGTLAFFAQRGMEGSDAGTSLKTALLALQAPTDVAAKTMSDLGINVRDANGKMLPMADIADVLKDRLSGLSDAQRDSALKQIFGNDAIRVGIGLYEGGGSAIRDWTAKVNDAGNAARTGATINDNLKGSLSQLGAVLETGAIQFGGKLTPVIRTATDEVAKFVQGVMDSPRAQAAFDSFATSAGTAITAFFTKVKDPAFQDAARQWATAALDVGKAVVSLGQNIGSTLGPPLREAVTWFNGLDQAGKEQVISFGLVAASAVKFRDELGTVKSVVEDVIKSFAAKEAAKKGLTAANNTLAGSAANTAKSFGGVAAAAVPAALAIADVAVVSGVAVGASVAMISAADGVQKKFGEQNDILAQSAAHWDAASIAIAHGGTEQNNAVVYFQKWLDVHGQTISSLAQGEMLWNQYVTATNSAGVGIAGLTTAQLGMLDPLNQTNARLGEGRIAGDNFNNTLVGIGVGAKVMVGVFSGAAADVDNLNNRLGEGRMAGDNFNNTLVGVGVGAHAMVASITAVASEQQQATKAAQDGQVAWLNAQNAQENYGGALATFGEQARHATDNFNALVQQQQAAGQQASVYSGQVGLLDGGMDRLNARYQQGIPLSAAQVASYQQAAEAAAFYRIGIGSLTESQFTSAIAAQQQIVTAEAMVRQTALLSGASTTVADSLQGQAGAYLTLVANVEATNSALRVATQEHSTLGGELNTFTGRVAALTQQEKDYAAGKAGVTALTIDERNQLGQLSGIIPGMTEAYRLQAVQVTNMEIAHVRANAALQEAQQAFQGQNTAMVSSGTALADAALKAGTLTQAQHDLAVASIASASNAFDLTAAINSIPGQHVTQFVVDAAGAIELVSQFGTHLFDVPKEYATKLQNNSTDLIPLIDQYGQAFLHVPADWVTNVNNNAGEQTPVVDGYGRIVAQIPTEWATTFLHNAGEVIPVVDNYGNVIKTVERSKVTEFIANTAGAQSAVNEFGQTVINIPPTATTTVSAPGAATAATDIGAVATAATTVPSTATTTVSAPGALGSAQAIGAHAAAALAVPQAATTNVTAPGALGSAVSIGAVTAAALAVPSATTTTSATVNTAQSAGQIAGVSAAVALVPKSFTVTANVDIGGALANIATLAANMPHSPAKEGPFKTLPNWQWVFSNFADGVSGALAEVSRLGGGISDTVAAGAKRTGEIMGSLATTVKSGMDALTGLAAFNPATMAPTDAQRGGFLAALAPLLADLNAATTAYSEESAKAATRWADTSGKLLGVVKAGLDALAGLVTFVAPAQANIAAFKFATESLVTSLGDSAAVMDADFVANAAVWAEGAGKSLTILKTGADGLRALLNFVAPTQANIAAFKFATESLVRSLGDSAVVMDSTFAANAGVWATGAGKALGILKSGVDGFAALATLVVPSQAAIGAFKFATEFVVQSIADTAAAMDARAVAAAAVWSDGAGKVLGLIKSGVDGLTALAAFVAPAPAAIDAFAVAVGQIVARFAVAAQAIGTEGVAAAGAFGTSAKLAVDTIKTGLDAFKSFKDMVIPSSGAIDELVAGVTYVVQRFADMADQMGKGALGKAQDFATAVGASAKSVQTAIGTFKSLTEAPFKGAMTAIMTEFTGDFDGALTLMKEATAAAGEYEAQAHLYEQAMKNAASWIAAGNAALATAALPGSGMGAAMADAGAHLGDSLASGMRGALEIHSPSQVMVTVGQQVVAGLVAGMSSSAQDAAKKAADVAKGIADAVTATLGAMKALGGLSMASLPSGGQVGAFVAFTGQLVIALSGAATSLTTTARDAASKYAEAASKVVSLVGSGVDAFGKLANVALPAVTAIYGLDRLIQAAVNDFAVIAEAVGTEMLGLATDFASGAGAVAETIGKAADGFAKLGSFAYTDGAMGGIFALGKAVRQAVQDFAAIAEQVGTPLLGLASSFADGAGKVVDVVGKGAAGFAKLADFAYTDAITAGIFAFGKAVRQVVLDFGTIAQQVGPALTGQAAIFADGAGKVVAIISNAVDGFAKLATYKGIANTLIGPFVETVRTLVAAIGQAATQFTTEGLTQAGQFADAASKAIGLLSGIDGFGKLAAFQVPAAASIAAFAGTVATMVRQIGAIATGFTTDGLAAASLFADTAGKVLGIVGNGVDGFAKLADFKAPLTATMGAFISSLFTFTATFANWMPTFATEQLAAASLFADTAGKVVGLISSGVDGFAKLATLVTPSGAAIGEFIRVATDMTSRFVAAVPTFAEGQLVAASLFADTTSKVVGLIGAGVDGFAKLATFNAPLNAVMGAFIDSVFTFTATFANWVPRLASEQLAAAGAFADVASKTVGLIGSGVDGFAKLALFAVPSSGAMGAFIDGIFLFTATFARWVPTFADGQLAAASLFADTAGKVIGLVGAGVDGFGKLADFRAPLDGTMGGFLATLIDFTARFVAAVPRFASEQLAAASAFADVASKAVGLIGTGVAGFAALADFRAPTAAALDAFAWSVGQLVARMVGIGAWFEQNGLDAAGTFADTAGKVLATLGSGVSGLTSLFTFVAPGLGALDAFAGAVRDMVARFTWIAGTLSGDGVRAAAEFGAATGTIFGALQSATGFFNSLDGLLLPDRAGIDRLLAPIIDTLAAVTDAANRIGAGGLEAATAFSTAVGAVFGAINTAQQATGGIAPLAIGGGGGSGGGGGGGMSVTIQINAPVYGVQDLQEAVVSGVIEARRRGRL